ncbi:CynX/NimT family MFS transporter [Marinobacter sp. X15-166B]|uniref:CynX/NimT family MFS transporter n=1 Tax=Marinobacter sp. X15-166B TaxID=1897620 RepID=UPI00085BD097|nr:MFS transporter [Marinobacter sp. X15-166B]OEY67581.1 MFS transporter [Marinobacter sp. X15-166B]
MNNSSSTHTRTAILGLIGLMLVAVNLRPALTGVGPLLRRIGETLTLSSAEQGVLTTLPVLFLGLAAPLAPRLARSLGIERAVLAVLLVLALAQLVRPYTGVSGLFLGTAVAGGCIGIAGVLLPGMVKRDYPQHASLLTGLYTATLCFGAALATGASEPLRQLMNDDWRPALAFWLLPAVVAAIVWWTRLDGKRVPREPVSAVAKSLFRDKLAWQVALYMGLQSSLAYTVFGWLPTILQDKGIDAVEAGLAVSASIMVQVVSAIMAPWVASYMRDQRAMIVLVMTLTLVGMAGSIYGPSDDVWMWVIVLGLGQGGTFSMALTLLAIRARDAGTAARLSGMAQSLGYTMAAAGPLLLGVLHGMTGDWRVAGVFLILIGLGATAAGVGAGRNRYVLDD